MTADPLNLGMWQQRAASAYQDGRLVQIPPVDLVRLLDLAERATAAEAAVERVRALADEWETWADEGPEYARDLRAAPRSCGCHLGARSHSLVSDEGEGE